MNNTCMQILKKNMKYITKAQPPVDSKKSMKYLYA